MKVNASGQTGRTDRREQSVREERERKESGGEVRILVNDEMQSSNQEMQISSVGSVESDRSTPENLPLVI